MTERVKVEVRRTGKRFEAEAVLDLAADELTVWQTITDYAALPRFMPGIRACRVQRTVLPRRQAVVATRFGTLKVKILTGQNDEQIVPEFEACRAAAHRHKVPLKDVYAEIIARGSALTHKH